MADIDVTLDVPREGSTKELVVVYLALMAPLGLTVALSFVSLGSFTIVVALAIAFAKTGLIALYFMHLRYRAHLTWLFAAAGLVWLLILIGLTLSDYLTRFWILVAE